MTTIAYRDGIMAADTRAFAGSSDHLGQKTKIYRMPDGGLLGVSTNRPGLGEAFANWMGRRLLAGTGGLHDDSGAYADAPNRGDADLTALLVMSDGSVFFFHDNYDPSGPIRAPFFAVGSGSRYAMGALAAGKGAEDAVRIACDLDPWTGGPIESHAIEGLTQVKH